jgi:hypothetical protein
MPNSAAKVAAGRNRTTSGIGHLVASTLLVHLRAASGISVAETDVNNA